MAIYGFLENNIDDITISESELHQLNIDLLETMMDLDEYDENDEDEFLSFEEGANLDILAIYKSHRKNLLNTIKSCKKQIRKRNFDDANRYLSDAKNELKKMETDIKNIESTTGSAVLGFVSGTLILFGDSICSTCMNLMNVKNIKQSVKNTAEYAANYQAYKYGDGSGGGPDINYLKQLAIATAASMISTSYTAIHTLYNQISVTIKAIIKIVKVIKQMRKDIQENTSNPNKFNLFRNTILTYCSDFEKLINKLQKMIDKRSKMK